MRLRGMSWIVRIGFFTILLLIGGCSPSSQPASLPTSMATTTTSQEANFEKLSSRLQMLQRNPALLTGSPEEMGKALSLPPNSLLKDDLGRILVSIRVKDASDAAVSALKNAGAQIVNISSQYGVVTAYIAVKDLASLAGLPGVLSIQEEMAPQSQSAGG